MPGSRVSLTPTTLLYLSINLIILHSAAPGTSRKWTWRDSSCCSSPAGRTRCLAGASSRSFRPGSRCTCSRLPAAFWECARRRSSPTNSLQSALSFPTCRKSCHRVDPSLGSARLPTSPAAESRSPRCCCNNSSIASSRGRWSTFCRWRWGGCRGCSHEASRRSRRSHTSRCCDPPSPCCGWHRRTSAQCWWSWSCWW